MDRNEETDHRRRFYQERFISKINKTQDNVELHPLYLNCPQSLDEYTSTTNLVTSTSGDSCNGEDKEKTFGTSSSRWTKYEDDRLIFLVQQYQEKDQHVDFHLISENFPSRSIAQCKTRWKKVLSPSRKKGQWTKEEDWKIIEHVDAHGSKNWTHLSNLLKVRNGKQCRERWHNHLDPEISKKPWTDAEDQILIRFQKELGNKWSKIAANLPGRTDNAVKNRWNSTLRWKVENNQYNEGTQVSSSEFQDQQKLEAFSGALGCHQMNSKSENRFYAKPLNSNTSSGDGNNYDYLEHPVYLPPEVSNSTCCKRKEIKLKPGSQWCLPSPRPGLFSTHYANPYEKCPESQSNGTVVDLSVKRLDNYSPPRSGWFTDKFQNFYPRPQVVQEKECQSEMPVRESVIVFNNR